MWGLDRRAQANLWIKRRNRTSPSLRIIWREVHASRANRGLERLEIVYNNSGFAVTIQVKQAIERLLGGVHVGQGGLGGGASGGAGLAGSGIEIGHFLNAVEGFDQGLHTQRD